MICRPLKIYINGDWSEGASVTVKSTEQIEVTVHHGPIAMICSSMSVDVTYNSALLRMKTTVDAITLCTEGVVYTLRPYISGVVNHDRATFFAFVHAFLAGDDRTFPKDWFKVKSETPAVAQVEPSENT